MKKFCCLLVFCLFALLALAGCAHTHSYTAAAPVEATCAVGTYIRHTCSCGDYYDEELTPALGHVMTKTEGIAVTCESDGRPEYYTCSRCEKHYTDERGTTELAESELVLRAGHRTTHHPAKEPLRFENGNWEYWKCNGCERIFLNEACTWEGEPSDVIISSAFNLVDFVVDVEEGREIVVLQLSDPQFTDLEGAEERCYRYIRETVTATKPDLILVTGDLVYGKFDTTGEMLVGFINLMEGFGIPWASVFGNHDNESEMGVDWQCEQLASAEHCLFERGDVSGNGNYTVGIAQGERLLRVFYMMDTNACGAPSEASVGKVNTHVGFQPDQIAWYTEDIRVLLEADPTIKLSFAFHIQPSFFSAALNRYAVVDEFVNIDALDNAADTDFGIIGAEVKTVWDGDSAIFRSLVSLGVDSIFVGHEHHNSASIVYDGVRLQYGQKSSTYDRYNGVMPDGTLCGGYSLPEGATPLMGGTVIPIDEDGEILTGYIYLCGITNK